MVEDNTKSPLPLVLLFFQPINIYLSALFIIFTLSILILLKSFKGFSLHLANAKALTTQHSYSIFDRPLNRLTNAQNGPHSNLLRICTLTNISLSSSPSLREIVQKTQQEWLRPLGTERHELQHHQYDHLKHEIIPLLESLNVTSAIYASSTKKPYEILLIHGAMANTIEKRMQFLVHEYNRGVRFKTIILLSGDRPLNPQKEAMYIQRGLKTEADMMQYIWDNLQGLPHSIKSQAKLVNTQGETKQSGYQRPTTRSTLSQWMTLHPPKKHDQCLAISSQPFVPFQDFVFYNSINNKKQKLQIETIGPSAHPSESIAIHLDNLARCLYELNTRVTE